MHPNGYVAFAKVYDRGGAHQNVLMSPLSPSQTFRKRLHSPLADIIFESRVALEKMVSSCAFKGKALVVSPTLTMVLWMLVGIKLTEQSH